jgi:CDP-glycerol glycerophosphotransferase (TagB/SpsB family)
MRAILFCVNPYAFGILKPLHDELTRTGSSVLWYVPTSIEKDFPFSSIVPHTHSMKGLVDFNSDAIFVPGNEVPHYLRGVKVQVFHGLAGEKKGHFRIRNYFDLYLTQGPYFTREFNRLKKRYKDFEVVETGWSKLDPLYQLQEEYRAERDRLLRETSKKTLLLYAPTFSPSLTSTVSCMDEVFEIADEEDVFLLIKFHDLTNRKVVAQYKSKAATRDNVRIVEERNILKALIMADFMISDTSSVVYEFILLNKPVITVNSRSQQITWCNITDAGMLHKKFVDELKHDNFKETRKHTIEEYHPYTDGKSAARMIAAVEAFIQQHGVPEVRKLNIYRRYQMNNLFGPKPN